MDDKEPFLARWSRRKLETKQDGPAAGERAVVPSPAAVPPAVVTDAPAPGRATADTPEYREFFDPQVDEKLRRTALKKLFNEPQFNVMDGLDTYIDDYSKPDPIPDAMLRQLNQAKDLLLFDEEQRGGEAAGDTAFVPVGKTGGAAAEANALPAAVDVSGQIGESANDAAAPPAEAAKNE
jgi:hypothetical protein